VPDTGGGDRVVTPPEIDVTDVKAPLSTMQENTRARMALGLLLLLAIVVFVLLGAAISHKLVVGDVRDLAAVLVTPLVALAGSATGFYFGSKGEGG
jgi:hypothetical protein